MKILSCSVVRHSAAILACLGFAAHAHGAVTLGAAGAFGVLGASTVTNTGTTVVTGDVGVSPGTSITGFPPGTASGTIRSNDATAIQAQIDANTAYLALAGLAPTQNLTGQNLGGLTLTPGVYFFSTTAQLTGVLTLDGDGASDPLFVFQIGSAFTSASNSSIITIDGADPSQVYFKVGSSATLGTNSSMVGTFIASDSITLNTGAELIGRAIALTGAVTLDTNKVIPEPSSAALLLSGMVSLLMLRKRSRTAD